MFVCPFMEKNQEGWSVNPLLFYFFIFLNFNLEFGTYEKWHSSCTGWVKKKLTGIGDVFKNKQMILKSLLKHILNKHSLLLIMKKDWNKLTNPKRSDV